MAFQTARERRKDEEIMQERERDKDKGREKRER